MNTPAAEPRQVLELPDPDRSNAERAARGAAAIAAYRGVTGTEDDDVLADLLCDLMHWADRNEAEFEEELDRANRNHIAETT